MATSNIANVLGAGSGIDIKSLAESLVATERAPRQQRIEARIAQSEARISGYGAIKFALSELKTAFERLNDASDFNALKPVVSQPSAIAVRGGPNAPSGQLEVQVLQLARPTRLSSPGFATRDAVLHPDGDGAHQPITLSLSVMGGEARTLAVAQPTPAALVGAINGWGQGLRAELLNTGDAQQPWRVVVTGPTGAAQDFTLQALDAEGNTLPDLAFALPPGTPEEQALNTAANAQLRVNGLAIERASNSLNDVIEGVTLDLLSTTVGSARIELNRDTSGIKANIQSLVSAYNDFDTALRIMSDRASDVEDFGGILAGDSLLQQVRSQVRALITGNADSTTDQDPVRALRDVGLSLDRDGILKLDEARLDAALQNRFEQVVTMFTANTNGQSVFSAAPAGVAGRAVARLDQWLRSNSPLAAQTQNATEAVKRQQAELERLDERMQRLLQRYMGQFSVMESLVGNSNNLRDNLRGTFEGLMAMYTNKR
jgi:flagellar hook-associated protein 2